MRCIGGEHSRNTIVKWSRDNGSDLFSLLSLSDTAIEVPANSPLRNGDLVEILSETIDLGDTTLASLNPVAGEFTAPTRAVGDLIRLRDQGLVNNGTRRRFSFRDRNDESVSFTLSDLNRYGTPDPVKLKVRRWHGTLENIEAGASLQAKLENGISLTLAGEFEVGDWWQYEARAGQANNNGDWQPAPHGPERLFAPLALLQFEGEDEPLSLVTWLDERFPALCSIDADDVAFDGDRISSDSNTVQEAIEELWTQVQSCGEIIARPTDNLQTIFNTIPDGEDAKICLHRGRWPLSATINVANKGELIITGAGFGTELQSSSLERVLSFSNCISVTIRDLSVKGGEPAEHRGGLRGAISFLDCQSVNLENVQAICNSSSSRRMSAIQVQNNDNDSLTDVYISKCRVKVGSNQVGILVVNGRQVSVTDNLIEHSGNNRDLADMITDPIMAASVGRVFMDRITIGETEEANDELLVGGDIVFQANPDELGRPRIIAFLEEWGSEFITFSTHPRLGADAWQDILISNPINLRGEGQERHGRLLSKLKQLRSAVVRSFLNGNSDVTVPNPWQIDFDRIEQTILTGVQSAGNQGIVISGYKTPYFGNTGDQGSGLFNTSLGAPEYIKASSNNSYAPNIKVLSNRVIGFIQGIHIGTSHNRLRSAYDQLNNYNTRDRRLRSYNVHIASNTVTLSLPQFAQERHGIFVGHAHSVRLYDNLIEVLYPNRDRRGWQALPPTDGIRLYGVYGPLVQIRQNLCIGMSTGIRLQARNAGPPENLYSTVARSVVDNAYAGFGTALVEDDWN